MFSGGRRFVSPGQFFREVAEGRSEASVRFWDFGSFRKNAFRGDRFDASSSPFIKKKITWGPEAGNWGGSRGGKGEPSVGQGGNVATGCFSGNYRTMRMVSTLTRTTRPRSRKMQPGSSSRLGSESPLTW